MTAIGITLLWCILQVTVVSGAAILLYFLAARSGATTRSGVALAGLLLAAALAPLAFLPWPHWTLDRATTGTSNPVAENNAEPDETIASPPAIPQGTTDLENPLVSAMNGFIAGLSQPQPPQETTTSVRTPINWPALTALLFLAASLTGLSRFLMGLVSVRRSVKRAAPVDDRALTGIVDVLRAELSCIASVEIRESAEIATAATTGWRRPVLLLPPEWRMWTRDERCAVIAHELAHVKRRDFAAAMISQAAVAVNFYHPLVHWLAGRLRLEQELAADALAATVSGGRTSYLRSLAELALRRSDGHVAWPARAFLPSRRTFLRRIEMLRDPRRAVDRPAPMLRIMTAVCLLAFAVVVAGIRPDPAVAQVAGASPAAPGQGDASPDRNTPETTPAVSAVAPAAYIPATANIVITVKPQAVLADPAVQPFVGEIEKGVSERDDATSKAIIAAGVTLKTVESVAVGLPSPAKKAGESATFAFRVNKPIDRAVLAKQADETKTVFGGVVYRFRESFITAPDERTVLVAETEEMVMAMIVSGQVNRAASPWLRVLANFDDPAFAILVDAETVGADVQQTMQRENQGPNAAALKAMSATVMPLLQDMKLAGLSLTLGKDSGLKGYALCDDESGAQRVRETLEALVTIGKNTLRQAKTQVASQPPQQQALSKMFFPIAETLLDSTKVEAESKDVTLTAKSGGNAAIAMGLLLPAIQQAREAARRTVSMNNMKQIALAFHNYNAVHGFFPPAVIEENGVTRSWRVEILPFLEQQALYDEYRKNEPWDSEHNKEVLAKAPPIYKDPSHASGPTITSYFALTGNGALFSDKPVDVKTGGKGPQFQDITDGLSNTILVVEAQRDVPWTKPEDIPFDPAKSEELLNSLGGVHGLGFLAALADGSVHYFERSIGQNMMTGLATSAGGEVIERGQP